MKNKSQYKKDPFSVEDLRLSLALRNDSNGFLKTYNSDFPEIKNFNSSIFWNQHFSTQLNLSDQDRMTQEKIAKITSILPRKKAKILDLGFGQGYLEEKLNSLKREYDLFGVDISDVAVKRATNKFNGIFTQCDISKIEDIYKKNTFDVITAIELIEHISPTKIFKFYKSIHSLLKTRGILIISTPVNEGLRNKKDNPSGHVREYQPAVIKMELELSGFKVLKTHQLYAFKKNYTFKKFLVRIFPFLRHPNNIIVMAVKA